MSLFFHTNIRRGLPSHTLREKKINNSNPSRHGNLPGRAWVELASQFTNQECERVGVAKYDVDALVRQNRIEKIIARVIHGSGAGNLQDFPGGFPVPGQQLQLLVGVIPAVPLGEQF